MVVVLTKIEKKHTLPYGARNWSTVSRLCCISDSLSSFFSQHVLDYVYITFMIDHRTLISAPSERSVWGVTTLCNSSPLKLQVQYLVLKMFRLYCFVQKHGKLMRDWKLLKMAKLKFFSWICFSNFKLNVPQMLIIYITFSSN